MAYESPSNQVIREQARRLRARQIRRRRLTLLAVVLAVVVLVVVIATRPGPQTSPPSGPAGGQTTVASRMYTASLTGDQNVPAVQTASTGSLTLRVGPDGTKLDFVLKVDGLTNTSIARIFDGGPGEIGQPVLVLYDGPVISGPLVGTVAEGTVDAADLTGGLAGKGIADLLSLIESGSAYVSVGNSSYPDGAIRGQIK